MGKCGAKVWSYNKTRNTEKRLQNSCDSPFLWESWKIYLLIINLLSSAAAVIKQFRAWSLKNASSNLVRIAATLGRSLLMFKNWLKKSDHREVSHHLKNKNHLNFWMKFNFVVIFGICSWPTVEKNVLMIEKTYADTTKKVETLNFV